MDDASQISPPYGLKRYQRFGDAGPDYEVLGVGLRPETVRVVVIESGEKFDYRLRDANTNPPA
jgi:hypothetical protein